MSEHAIPVEIARELVRQGEARLKALLDLATAADLRATTLCGIFGAASVGTGAAVLADIASDHPLTRLILAGGIVAFGLFSAATLAGFSGAPRNFFIGGGSPDLLRSWAWSGQDWRDEKELLDATALRYAQSIEKNRLILEAGSKRVNLCLAIGFLSPIAGLLVFAGSYLCG